MAMETPITAMPPALRHIIRIFLLFSNQALVICFLVVVVPFFFYYLFINLVFLNKILF